MGRVMLNQVVTAFIVKSEDIMEQNPEIMMWCWRVSAGDRRSHKKVVESSKEWNSDSQDLIDEMWEALTKLEGEPVDNAWLELLARGQSRIFHYEHVEISEPSEAPQIIMPDGKRVGIGGDYSQAVMATQLVRTNDQLLNLSMGLARMNSTLTQKQMDVAVAYTELETEGRIRGEVDATNNMAEALKVVGPMLQAAFIKYTSTPPTPPPRVPDEAEPHHGAPQEPEHPEVDTSPSDADIDDLIERIEWVCQFHPVLLTESRIARVVTAFGSAPSPA